MGGSEVGFLTGYVSPGFLSWDQEQRRVSDPTGDPGKCSAQVCSVEATAPPPPPESSTEAEHHPASSPGPCQSHLLTSVSGWLSSQE